MTQNSSKPPAHRTLPPAHWLATAAIVLTLVWLLNTPVMSLLVASWQDDKSGTFVWPDGPGTLGDSFGALTSLFSALSFWAVLAAMYFQRKDSALNEQLLREQMTEAKLEIFVDSLPYWIISIGEYMEGITVTMANGAASVFDVRAQNSMDESKFQSAVVHNAPESYWIGLALQDRVQEIWQLDISYSTKYGKRLTERFKLPNPVTPKFVASSDRAAIVEAERIRLSKPRASEDWH